MGTLLEGKKVVITGGSSGIGLATAKLFAEEGARVLVSGRRQSILDKAVVAIGHGAVGVKSDAGKGSDIEDLFRVARSKLGTIDALVINASIAEAAPLSELTEEHIDRHLAVNVKGMALTAHYALPLLASGASIILTSSIDIVAGGPGRSIYSATKAAERNFARSWLSELADRGVRVNALLPGATATPGLAGLVGADDSNALFSAIGEGTPRGSIILPEEVAKAALFLASDLSSGVNGIELPVDGGWAQVR